jgi:hypothetical protein
VDFLVLLGPDEPAAVAAAQEARIVFDRVGARPYLERLEAALAPGSATSVPDAAPVARAVASPAEEAPAPSG